jgi:hypothetical protein
VIEQKQVAGGDGADAEPADVNRFDTSLR